MYWCTGAAVGVMQQRVGLASAPDCHHQRCRPHDIPWDCQYFCARPVIRHEFTKRSLNTTANCVFASAHSRGCRFHSATAWFKIKYSSFVAASSEGKCPLVLTARRSLEFSASNGIRGVDDPSHAFGKKRRTESRAPSYGASSARWPDILRPTDLAQRHRGQPGQQQHRSRDRLLGQLRSQCFRSVLKSCVGFSCHLATRPMSRQHGQKPARLSPRRASRELRWHRIIRCLLANEMRPLFPRTPVS